MAKKKENLKDMKAEDLQKKLTTLQEDLRVIRFKAESSKTKNVKEAAHIKKNIAQILTALKQLSK
ncbi:MAG: 50S ribosomal protein L29 [Patescibacteria group bacterium]